MPAWYVDSWPRGKQHAQKLIKSGFWVAKGEDYQFLSWEEYQRTKKYVEIDKAKARERKAEWRRNRNGTAPEQ